MVRVLIGLTTLILFFSCAPKAIKEQAPAARPAPNYPEAYVIKETVNIRNAGSASGRLIKQLKDGEKVYLLENKNGWYKIQDETGSSGWLRSDLVGPENLSRTRLAAVFVDSLLPDFGSAMFFDKEDLYSVIYLILPEAYYESAPEAERFARKIGILYQEKVYPGTIEMRIMTRDKDNLFSRISLPAIENPNTPVPVIESGRLISLSESNRQVRVGIAVRQDLNKSELLQLARKISRQYELPYTKAEVYIANDSKAGIDYLNNTSQKPGDPATCLLYYLEDKDGEYYQFGFCAD